jgi:DNA-binding IscR family transcriptional regulator
LPLAFRYLKLWVLLILVVTVEVTSQPWYAFPIQKSSQLKGGLTLNISTRYSDAIHILAYLVIYAGTDLSSDTIANSVETSPIVVRRLMGKLRAANLIQTQRGVADPKLARTPDKITLLDVLHAVEPDQPVFAVDPKTNPLCIVGGNIQTVLTNVYAQATAAAQHELAVTTLQMVIDQILTEQHKKEQSIL